MVDGVSTTSSKRGRARVTVRRVVGAVIVAASLFFIAKGLRLFSFRPDALGKYFPFKWAIMGHVAGGMLALLTGPFQLSKAFRNANRRAHRVMGRIYAGGVAVGAVCALVLASTTALVVGWAYALSLHVLAGVWLTSTILAWRTAVGKRFATHEEWASRSYIATVAFVMQSLAFHLPFLSRLGSFAETSPTLIWTSWTVPMFAYACMRARAPAKGTPS